MYNGTPLIKRGRVLSIEKVKDLENDGFFFYRGFEMSVLRLGYDLWKQF